MENNSGRKEVYFASANSYYGFRSYFDVIFNSKNFTKIYVLKGGPGTGKSTIMKKCRDFAEKQGYLYEIFCCSSDPKSLDGIVLWNNSKKIAILDGTAPHERDAVIPGAVDELIALSNGFDISALEKRRNAIEELNKKKNLSYREAYKYLSFSSVFAEKIKAEIKSCFNIEKAYKHAEAIAATLPDSDLSENDIRLISSFSKNGYETLPTLPSISSIEYSVFGKWGSDAIYMNLLLDALRRISKKARRFPSPLDSDKIEALTFMGGDVTVSCMGRGDILCDTTEFLNSELLIRMDEYLDIFDNAREKFLMLATEQLSEASKYHFLLEEIYTEHMDFSVIDEIRENLFVKIKNILSV